MKCKVGVLEVGGAGKPLCAHLVAQLLERPRCPQEVHECVLDALKRFFSWSSCNDVPTSSSDRVSLTAIAACMAPMLNMTEHNSKLMSSYVMELGMSDVRSIHEKGTATGSCSSIGNRLLIISSCAKYRFITQIVSTSGIPRATA